MESKKPEVKATFSSHTDVVLTACFSPDQTKLCSAGYDEKLILTNLQNNQTDKVFTDHEDTITGSDFSFNGEFSVTGSADKTIRIWKASGSESGNSTKLEGHSNWVECVLYLRKELNHVISGSGDKTIKLWSIERKKEISTLLGCEDYVLSVDILPDNRTLVSGDSGNKVRFWDLRSGKCVQTLDHHKDEVKSVHLHPNSFSLASGSLDETIKIVDFRTFQLLQDYQEHTYYVRSVFFHPSGKYLLSGSFDNSIKVFDLFEKKVLFTLTDHSNNVRCVQFSPDGKLFVSGSRDNKVFLWNFPLGESFEKTNPNSSSVEKKLLEMNEEVKLMKIEHENMQKKIVDLEQTNTDQGKKILKLERKNTEQGKKIVDLERTNTDQGKKILNLERNNSDLKIRFDRHLDHFHRNKYKIVNTTISPTQKMIQKEEKRICFLNDSFRFQIDFEVVSGPGPSSPIDFSTIQISFNDDVVIPNSEIQISPKSVSFDLLFSKLLGENEIKIIFENVVFVENSSLCVSKTELLLFRGELEPDGTISLLPNTQPQEKFHSSDLVQVCLSFVNENDFPLRLDHVKDFEFGVKLTRKGEKKSLRGKYLSREFQISVEKEEDFVRISGGRKIFVVCKIGKDENLGTGDYDIGVADVDLTKKKVFSIQ